MTGTPTGTDSPEEKPYKEADVSEVIMGLHGVQILVLKTAVKDQAWEMVFNMLKIETDEYPTEHFEVINTSKPDNPLDLITKVRWR